MDGLLRDAFAMPTLEETISGEVERNPEVGANEVLQIGERERTSSLSKL